VKTSRLLEEAGSVEVMINGRKTKITRINAKSYGTNQSGLTRRKGGRGRVHLLRINSELKGRGQKDPKNRISKARSALLHTKKIWKTDNITRKTKLW